MALQGGHRFQVSMAEVFPAGLYTMSVDEAQDYNEVTKARTPSRDKVTGSPVFAVTCIDLDKDARSKEVKIKLLAPYMPELPPEIVPDSGLRPVEFLGLMVTPYIDEGRGRPRMAFSFRATGLQAAGLGSGTSGKAPAGSATVTGRSGGQAPWSAQGPAGSPQAGPGSSRAA